MQFIIEKDILSTITSKRLRELLISSTQDSFYEEVIPLSKNILPTNQPPQDDITDLKDPLSFKTAERADNILLWQYMEFWLSGHRRSIDVTTYASYYYYVRRIIHFKALGTTLGSLNEYVLEDFYGILEETGISANTIRHYHAILHKTLQDLFVKHKIPYNYADLTHRKPVAKYIPNIWSVVELQEAVVLAQNTSLFLPIICAGFYGPRREEIVGLNWLYFNFFLREFTMKRTVTECTIERKKQSQLKKGKKRNLYSFPSDCKSFLPYSNYTAKRTSLLS